MDLNAAEVAAIKEFKTRIYEGGYNISAGGDSAPKTPEWKAKIGAANTGNKRPDLAARNKTPEMRAATVRRNVARTGERRPNSRPDRRNKAPDEGAAISAGLRKYYDNVDPQIMSERGKRVWKTRRANAAKRRQK